MSRQKIQDSYKAHLGAVIRRLRRARGWTQGDLARKVGLAGPAAINNYERGRTLPKGALIKRLAVALGATVDEMLPGGEGLVSESVDEYGRGLDRRGRIILKEAEDLLREADDQTKNEMRHLLGLLRRAAKSPRGRASGED